MPANASRILRLPISEASLEVAADTAGLEAGEPAGLEAGDTAGLEAGDTAVRVASFAFMIDLRTLSSLIISD